MYWLLIIPLLAVCYVLALTGRKHHPGLRALQGWSYAHRGLHGPGRPENSLSAFRAAVEAGCGAELDVHLLKDGSLAVIHDSSLKRTTGKEGTVEELTAGQLQAYFLEGTGETIPLFSQVLEIFEGKAPLIVELKTLGGNYAALCEKTCQLLDGYRGVYCIESFDPRCVLWLRKHRPDIIRGQLVEDFTRVKSPVPWILRFMLTHQLLNFMISPDFVAHKFADRKLLSNFLVRRLWGIQGVSWTLRSREDMDTAVKEGYIPIFESFLP